MAEVLQTYYGVDPWENISQNQRVWYDPILQQLFRRQTVYSNGLIPFATQPLLPVNASEMIIPMVYDFEPSTAALGLRHTNVAPQQLDSRQVRINSTRYGFATAYDKYDTYISYWKQAGGGTGPAAMTGLIRERVGRVLQESLDLLIRNAFLSTPYIRCAGDKTAATLTKADRFDLAYIDDAFLRGQYQDVMDPSTGMGNNLAVIGAPAHTYDIVTGPANSKWIELQKYTSQTPFNQYEIGSYHNSRFFSTRANTLWNCGATKYQKKITAAALPRDGAPNPNTDKVDSVYEVGQHDASMKHYIQLEAWAVGDADSFAVGDMVTLHKRRVTAGQAAAAPAIKVTDAPPFDDPDTVVRRIVAIDDGNNRIVLDKPIMRDYTFKVADDGSGAADNAGAQYGWVTKGINLHAAIMIAAPGGVVCGTFAPPRIYEPQPLDLFQSVWQIGWDMYMKFQVIKPEVFEVVITAGTSRVAMKSFDAG